MKKIFAHTAIAASLLCSIPAFAGDAAVVAAAPAVPAPVPAFKTDKYESSELVQAMRAVSAELKALQALNLAPKAKIAKYNSFDFSPATRQKLLKVFGTEKPWKLQAVPRADGKVDVSLAVDALNYTDPVIQGKVQWAALNGVSTYDSTFHHADIKGTLPWFSLEHNDGWTFKAEDISVQSAQDLNAHRLWLGDASFRIASMRVDNAGSSTLAQINDTQVQVGLSQRAQLVDMSYSISTQSVKWEKDELGPTRAAFKMHNLSEKAMAQLQQEVEKQARGKAPVKKQNEAMLALFKKDGLKLLTPATSLDVQEISAVYRGFKAMISGKLFFKDARQSDLTSFAKIKEKLVAHFDFEMPMGLAEEIARLFSRKSLEQKAEKGQPVADDAVNQMANLMVTQMVENLRKQNLILVDGDTLRSSVDFASGKFSVNGKPVPFNLPKTGK
ncbi:DUF945 family protein [Undibacterium terreum]|uniref:DUF945 family protein n=1 Tax=Undibacterium terreum TaxID=1224302 RepID=A0A916UC38_9BURK|nr:DUF945 family protein [Undibacterium terreum]GGC68020.1 hypothetical protein GCM10011396_13850 [Undibacterium terreum]